MSSERFRPSSQSRTRQTVSGKSNNSSLRSKIEEKLQIPFDPRQRDDPLQARIAALAISLSSSSSIAEGPSTAPGPFRYAEPWGLRGQRLSHVPEGDLGPADLPRRRGRPKGSKSRPRVAFEIATLPERQEKLRAGERLVKMASKYFRLGGPWANPPRSTACPKLVNNTPRALFRATLYPFSIFLSFAPPHFRPPHSSNCSHTRPFLFASFIWRA